MKTVKTRLIAVAALCLCLAGCDSFERATFKTLSASKAVIDQSQADYEARVFPKNACSYAVINEAKGVQKLAVDAMVVYEQEKVVNGDLTAQTAIVVAELGKLPALIGEVKSLYSNPASLCGSGKAGVN
jgi:hypothetical protein